MMRVLFLFCALLLSAGSLTFAQNTASLPWWTSPVVSDLINQEQQQRIRQIIRSYRDRLFDARNNAQKAEADVSDQLNEANVNPLAVRPAIERLAQARAQSTRIFTMMSVEIRAVLTQEQWRQLLRRWADVQRTKQNRDTELAP